MPKFNNLVLVGAALLVGLVIVELGLRAAGVSYPEFHRLDPVRGWVARPGVEGRWSLEGGARLRINRAGFRDRDHAVVKPPGTLRIAVLGDSYTEAREIPEDGTFWSVLERELATCERLDRAGVEVLNFGVSGYGTVQQLLTLEQHVWAYDPDVVLLAFYTGNDVWNNSRELEDHPDRPYLVLGDGAPMIDNSFRDSVRFKSKLAWQDAKHWLVNRLRFLQVIKEGYYRIKRAFAREADASAGLDGPVAADDVYLAPRDDAWREAWRITEEALRMMNDAARSRGSEFWIATLSNPIQVHPDPGLRRRFADKLGAKTLLYPDMRIKAFGEHEDIPVITLVSIFQDYAQTNGVFLHGFANTAYGVGHWNETAHGLAGARIAAEICASRSGVGESPSA